MQGNALLGQCLGAGHRRPPTRMTSDGSTTREGWRRMFYVRRLAPGIFRETRRRSSALRSKARDTDHASPSQPVPTRTSSPRRGTHPQSPPRYPSPSRRGATSRVAVRNSDTPTSLVLPFRPSRSRMTTRSRWHASPATLHPAYTLSQELSTWLASQSCTLVSHGSADRQRHPPPAQLPSSPLGPGSNHRHHVMNFACAFKKL